MAAQAGTSRGLLVATALTAVVFAVELTGGIFAHSLALLSDAAHVFMDVVALAVGWLALVQARRPATPRRTFGFVRLEMIAALGTSTQLLYMVNFGVGILLAGIAGVLAVGLLGLNPTSGNALLMPAFICVIIGGMGSLLGSIAGGILLGLVIAVTTLYVPAASEVSMFVLMAIVLSIRPRGLFGEEGIFG